MAFVRKELVELVRQPRLLVVLVVGPFLLLLAFGAGYDSGSQRLRTLFVGPPGSVYEHAIGRYTQELSDYVEPVGFTSDIFAAGQRLEHGDVDLIVNFPADPVDSVLTGEQAVIVVLHDKLNPIERAAVEIASRLAVQELNAAVLTNVVSTAQSESGGLTTVFANTSGDADELQAALGQADPAAIEAARIRLDESLDRLDAVASTSVGILSGLEPDQTTRRSQDLDALRTSIAEVRATSQATATQASGPDAQAKSAELQRALTGLDAKVQTFEALKPGVLVRPFAASTRTVLPQRVGDTDFFTPSSVALLLQHLAVTFAALSLVRDRSLGLYEMFRVGPISAVEILIGKYFAYLVLGAVVGGALIATAVYGLGVPFAGSSAWAGVTVLLVLAASLGLGIVISQFSRSESQAVQFGMLTLLAGLFFGGFTLDLDALRYPAKVISWLLPVTYGIRMLQDVMLRGTNPDHALTAGIAALAVGYGTMGVLLFHRRLAIE